MNSSGEAPSPSFPKNLVEISSTQKWRWEEYIKEHGFSSESIPLENGALLYFRAILQIITF
jgi:hypothetical protein